MAEKRKSAAVATATDGRQVLVYIEPAGEGFILRQVTEFDGGQVDLTVKVDKSTPELDVVTYQAISNFDTERADRILAQMGQQFGGLIGVINGHE